MKHVRLQWKKRWEQINNQWSQIQAIIAGLFNQESNEDLNRIKKCKPAGTKVDERNNSDTGVGTAIAASNYEEIILFWSEISIF